MAILVPLGAFFYIRMWSFRLRLLKDLRVIKQTNEKMTSRIEEIMGMKQQSESSEQKAN